MSDIEKYRPQALKERSSTPIKPLDRVVEKYRKERRYLLLFDATGSMSRYWDETRKSIHDIISRILSVAQGMQVRLKIIAYRDEDFDGNLAIQSSGWESESKALQNFISTIDCSGGGDAPESVDLALRKALEEQDLARIILIGDAPPHANRNCNSECLQLAERKIPVFSVLVGSDSEAKNAFCRISQATGGSMIALENITELFELIALVFVADLGRKIVDEYTRKYPEMGSGARKLLKALTAGSK